MSTLFKFKKLLKEIYFKPVEIDKNILPSRYEFSKFSKFVSRITLSMSVGIPAANLISLLFDINPLTKSVAFLIVAGFETFLLAKCMAEMNKTDFFGEELVNTINEEEKINQLEAAWFLYELRQAEIKEEDKTKNKTFLKIENFLYSLRIIQKNQLLPVKKEKILNKNKIL